MTVYIISFVLWGDMMSLLMPTRYFYKCFWERFGVLLPKPNEFDANEPSVVVDRGVRIEITNLYKPRGLRWVGVKPTTKRRFSKEIDVESNYYFSPYSHTPRAFHQFNFIRTKEERGH